MRRQGVLGQIVVLALLAALSGAVYAATLFSASAQGDGTDAATAEDLMFPPHPQGRNQLESSLPDGGLAADSVHEPDSTCYDGSRLPADFHRLPVEGCAGARNTDDVDIVVVYDRSGSMEYDTVCYGCWEPAEDEQYPDGSIYPLPWSSSTIDSADHCATDDRYHESGGEYYIVIEAEEYSRLNSVDYTWAITTPYHTYWAVQRNDYNAWADEPVGAKGRDTRGAYLSHHPYANYLDTTGLGVSCTYDDLTDGEYCRRGLPEDAGGPFPAPRADYDFYAPRAGNYYFHIRGQGGRSEHDRHMHWGVDGSVVGQEGSFPQGSAYDGAVGSAWEWRRLGGAVPLSEGDHTLHLWAGGAGFDVDRIVVTTDDLDPLPSDVRNLSPNDGRTDWACDPCDPRFAGRPGGHDWTAEEPYYRPDCAQDQRHHPIYDDEQPIRDTLQGAKYLVDRLNPCFDQVGYVPYSDQADIASELECLRRRGAPDLESPDCDPDQCTPGEEPPCDPDCGCFAGVITNTVLYQLDRTRAGGATNIAHGIQLGTDVLSTTSPHYGRPGAAAVVVLLTDGQANRYPGSPECWEGRDEWPDTGDAGIDRAAECAIYYAEGAREHCIAIYTISLGGSADGELMAYVAELTGGRHRHASTTAVLYEVLDDFYDEIFLWPIAQKSASPATPFHGQTVTYTVVVHGHIAPPTATVHLTDEVPVGLSYLTGTLTATAGAFTDAAAPTLRWSGTLSPTTAVTVTYAVTVSATTPQAITNTAVIAATGCRTITRTATVQANWHRVYLPLILR